MENTAKEPQITPVYAPRIRRLAAALIDGMILGVISGVIRASFAGNDLTHITLTSGQSSFTTSISFLISAFYSIGFWVKRDGQTPGKQAMHIKVVRESNEPMDWFTGIVRYLSTFLSGAVLGLGYIWILFDPKRQAWHDKIAKTLVVESDDQKPNGCFTFFGCFLPLLFIVFVAAAGAYFAFQKIKLNEAKSPTSTSLSKTLNAMSPAAKVHYDKSLALFKQINASTDQKQQQTLNDQNIAEIKQALATDPNNAQLWMTLGNAYTWPSTGGTLDDGINALNKAEAIDPNNSMYPANKANILWMQNKNDDAILEANKALRIDATDNYAFPHEVLARAYRDNKIFDQARAQYQKAIDVWTKENSTGEFDSNILEAQKEMAALPK